MRGNISLKSTLPVNKMQFVFKDDSWWDNTCDCCEATLMECYNYVGNDFVQNGSAHSYLNICEQILDHLDIPYGDDDAEEICDRIGVEIVIEY